MEAAEGEQPRRRVTTLRYTFISQVNGVLVSIACAAFYIFAHYCAVTSWGSSDLLHVANFLLLPTYFAIPGIFVASLLVTKKSLRREAGNAIPSLLLFLVLMWFAIERGKSIRHQGFINLAHRSQSLVQAVHQYVTDKGHPPTQLTDLIPGYLPGAPETGMGAYPEYELIVPNPQGGMYYQGQPWVLRVFTPAGGLNFDEFLYFPNQNYPKYGYGGMLEQIGDWAYLHE